MLDSRKVKLLELGRLCNSLSYRKTLERGYVIVRDVRGGILHNSRDAALAEKVVIEFRDDQLHAEIKAEKKIKP